MNSDHLLQYNIIYSELSAGNKSDINDTGRLLIYIFYNPVV